MTPHNDAKKGEIAKTVIMPGDPIRARLIVDTYFDEYKLVSNVRGIPVYTGLYKGKEISVMASGMGIPSMGIYSYELFSFYDVDNIIKVGTAGSYKEDIKLGDIVLIDGSYSESTYAKVMDNYNEKIVYSSNKINEIILEINKNIIKGNIHSTDVFYESSESSKKCLDFKCIGCEMESFSLFYNAKKLNKNAAQLLTITDNLVTDERMSSSDRQNKVMEMIEIALESAIKL